VGPGLGAKTKQRSGGAPSPLCAHIKIFLSNNIELTGWGCSVDGIEGLDLGGIQLKNT
jgi:hypothetical protein